MARRRHATAADAAAAFREAFERRQKAKRARILATRQRQADRDIARVDKEAQQLVRTRPPPEPPKPAPRIARPDEIGPDTLFVLVSVPIATYFDLMNHCRDFGMTPQGFIKAALAQAKLSRGGV